jgi:hypothetical protein
MTEQPPTQPGQPYPTYPSQQYPPAYSPHPWPQPQNGTGTAAMVLGILSLAVPYIGFICGILAIVFGKQGMNRADARLANNRGQAKAGFICGIVSICLYAAFFLVIVVLRASTSGNGGVSL